MKSDDMETLGDRFLLASGLTGVGALVFDVLNAWSVSIDSFSIGVFSGICLGLAGVFLVFTGLSYSYSESYERKSLIS
jgi:hypothetical protein